MFGMDDEEQVRRNGNRLREMVDRFVNGMTDEERVGLLHLHMLEADGLVTDRARHRRRTDDLVEGVCRRLGIPYLRD